MAEFDLADLRLRWVEHVLFGTTLSPDEFAEAGRPRRPRCWFGQHIPGIDGCEGPIEGAHWIKRRRVEKTLARAFGLPEVVVSPQWQRQRLRHGVPAIISGMGVGCGTDGDISALELVLLAAWDPRNGVPGCEKHHRRFDSQRMPTLTIWRHEVPSHVEAFARDWGLETALEDRNPAVGSGL